MFRARWGHGAGFPNNRGVEMWQRLGTTRTALFCTSSPTDRHAPNEIQNFGLESAGYLKKKENL